MAYKLTVAKTYPYYKNLVLFWWLNCKLSQMKGLLESVTSYESLTLVSWFFSRDSFCNCSVVVGHEILGNQCLHMFGNEHPIRA